MKMGQDMRVSGDKISKMVLENNNGQMDRFTKDNIRMDVSTAKESLYLWIKVIMKVNFSKMKFTERVNSYLYRGLCMD